MDDELTSGTVDRAQARVGTILRGKWRLDKLLGLGGMAAVYAATHRNGSRGAIKLLHPELTFDANVTRRFLREGYVANFVSHPGTVKVIDDDMTEDGAAFLVMELLDGETLESRSARRGGKLSPLELLPLAIQLLDVLAAAHEAGVVHRDVKPDNIFVTRAGTVKLLDFGIARLRRNQGSLATATGATFGTPAFMPPEQALGRTAQVDAKSDLWAVGATLFTLLAGRTVHVTETLNELLVAHAAIPAPSLSSVVSVPRELVAVVDRALAFDKAQRWPDARTMQSALRAVLEAFEPTVQFARDAAAEGARASAAGAGALEQESASALPDGGATLASAGSPPPRDVGAALPAPGDRTNLIHPGPRAPAELAAAPQRIWDREHAPQPVAAETGFGHFPALASQLALPSVTATIHPSESTRRRVSRARTSLVVVAAAVFTTGLFVFTGALYIAQHKPAGLNPTPSSALGAGSSAPADAPFRGSAQPPRVEVAPREPDGPEKPIASSSASAAPPPPRPASVPTKSRPQGTTSPKPSKGSDDWLDRQR